MDRAPDSAEERILVAYDASLPARHALEAAVETAQKTGGRLLLLNVMQPPTGAGGSFVYWLEDLDEQGYREATRMLEEVRKRLPESIKAEMMVCTGEPCVQIPKVAKEWGADLLVIGLRGRGRLAQFLLGCTVEEVIRNAHCPVMAVGLGATWGGEVGVA